MRFSLENKIALITGAGSGIGAAIAEIFADAGAFTYITDRDRAAAENVADRVRNAGGNGEALALDVTSVEQCAETQRAVSDRHGGLDILVNNAGIGHVGTMLTTSGEDMDRLYEVNVRGVFNLTKLFLPGMIERGRGSVIHLASIGGLVGVRDRLAYCTTKFAVVGMTRCMALDHAASGVRINCICPGRVETPFVSARLKEYPDPDRAYREMSATQPIGRMGQPIEIAHAALYLASDEASLVTGSTFNIDGGWSAG